MKIVQKQADLIMFLLVLKILLCSQLVQEDFTVLRSPSNFTSARTLFPYYKVLILGEKLPHSSCSFGSKEKYQMHDIVPG